MDRNFGLFLKEAQENPRPKKSKFRRRRKQMPSTTLEDVGSDDSLSREMPGFFPKDGADAAARRLPQSEGDESCYSDDEPFLTPLFHTKPATPEKQKEWEEEKRETAGKRRSSKSKSRPKKKISNGKF